jgi:hypothetical protein
MPARSQGISPIPEKLKTVPNLFIKNPTGTESHVGTIKKGIGQLFLTRPDQKHSQNSMVELIMVCNEPNKKNSDAIQSSETNICSYHLFKV